MSDTGNSIIFLMIGLVVGGAAGHFVTKKIYAEKSEKEITAAQQYYKSRLKKYIDITPEKEDVEERKESSEVKDTAPTLKETLSAAEPIMKKYDTVTRDYTKKGGPEIVKDNMVPKMFSYPSDDVYEMSDLDRREVYYFEGDDTLTDFDGEQLDQTFTVGESFADHFDDYESGVSYVQNNKTGTIYKIILRRGCADTEFGYSESDDE